MPVSFGETTITRATCDSRIRAISHALPVTSSATQSRGSRLCPKSSSASGRAAIRPAERTRTSATIATSQKSRWTSSAIALITPPQLDDAGEPVGNDIDGSALAAQPGKSQGRPLKRPGSNTPIVQNGLPSLRSPKDAPRPGQPNLGRPPDVTGAFDEQFHAPTRDSRGARLRRYRTQAEGAAGAPPCVECAEGVGDFAVAPGGSVPCGPACPRPERTAVED